MKDIQPEEDRLLPDYVSSGGNHIGDKDFTVGKEYF